MFSLIYKWFIHVKCLRKLKYSRMELFTVSGMLHIPDGVDYKGVNAETVLYLALKFHKALLSLHKVLFTP